jgi:hypothetical protein
LKSSRRPSLSLLFFFFPQLQLRSHDNLQHTLGRFNDDLVLFFDAAFKVRESSMSRGFHGRQSLCYFIIIPSFVHRQTLPLRKSLRLRDQLVGLVPNKLLAVENANALPVRLSAIRLEANQVQAISHIVKNVPSITNA